MSKKINELDHVYGSLQVIASAPSKNGLAAWLCRCECGKEKIYTGHALRSGQATSCGECYIKQERMRTVGKANAVDISGITKYKLTAIERVGSASYGGATWRFQCECGNYHIAEMSNFMNGQVKSCGCLTSQGEYTIQSLLQKLNIEYQKQFYQPEWKLESGYHPYYDFAIFDNGRLKCLIEFHGEQHRKYYTNSNTWNNKNNFDKTVARDEEKEHIAKAYGIPLYIIWYDQDIKIELLKILTAENLKEVEISDIINM